MKLPTKAEREERHDRWVILAADHWKAHLPKKWKALNAEGDDAVNAALHEAARLTARDMDDFLEAGVPHDQAWEIVRGRYLILDPEQHGETEEESLEPEQLQQAKDRKELHDLLQVAVHGEREDEPTLPITE